MTIWLLGRDAYVCFPVLFCRGSRVVEGGMVFGWSVLEALLECLDSILQCQSAGALHWFFTLLNHVKWCNPWGTARKVNS